MALRWPRLILVTTIAAIAASGFGALGLWQVQRLGWKRDLIARVDSRIHAPPTPAPTSESWPGLTAENAEYRRVTLSGRFLNDQEVQMVYTPSDLGPSYWVLTPLRRADGSVVMINRGLVPEAYRRPETRSAPEGPQVLTGLLRISESRGWLFSRPNDPENGQWYRRDIGSITRAKALSPAAPYFVDLEAPPSAPGASPDTAARWPEPGHTVVAFRNAHLSYALTWFALMLFVLGAWIFVLRSELRRTDA